MNEKIQTTLSGAHICADSHCGGGGVCPRRREKRVDIDYNILGSAYRQKYCRSNHIPKKQIKRRLSK